MFDAKKLLDALGTPAPAGGQVPASPASDKPIDAAKPSPANPLGAGTLLSDLIGLANRQSPPPPAPETAGGEQPAPKPAKAASPPPPADLTDLLLGKAQEYLKTPQGNAAVHAVVAGLTKAVVNSETGRKLTATAKTKGTALFNRFLNKGGEAAPLIEAQPALPPPVPTDAENGDTALLVMRAMIAAAAADGRIDDGERARILGALKSAGIEGEGVHIIEADLAHPASAAELAAAVKTPEAAVQVYTAARRIITPNTVEERVFLAHLSGALGLKPRLVAQIDAMASGAIQG
ncbi:DUF533 domain-containing protein [Microvirga sp. 2TAF3]|uniref:DUF533 domain-containing protein n=1 Tax=Microvirga sp. 2TAF3 TaxID=3233014 RepID=UPI003F9C3237